MHTLTAADSWIEQRVQFLHSSASLTKSDGSCQAFVRPMCGEEEALIESLLDKAETAYWANVPVRGDWFFSMSLPNTQQEDGAERKTHVKRKGTRGEDGKKSGVRCTEADPQSFTKLGWASQTPAIHTKVWVTVILASCVLLSVLLETNFGARRCRMYLLPTDDEAVSPNIPVTIYFLPSVYLFLFLSLSPPYYLLKYESVQITIPRQRRPSTKTYWIFFFWNKGGTLTDKWCRLEEKECT